jgi:hypothetical protein
VLAIAASCAAAVSAQSGDLMKPKSKDDVHDAVVLPDTATCQNRDAFDVTLGLSPSASQVKVARTNVSWAGNTTVSEFERSAMPPYTRFIFHETPQSHRVSWAMGVAFFASEALAREAGAKIARWYADALQVEVRDLSSGMYSLSEGELSLMVLVDEKAVRVSCEHRSTQNLAIQEGVDRRSGN